MYDISAANIVQVVIDFDNGFPLTFEQEDFSADTNPIRISGGAVASSQIDMAGDLVPVRRRTPIRVELAPIPNTQTDGYLKEQLLAARNTDPTMPSSPTITKMSVQIKQEGNAGVLTLEDGYPVDGGFLDIMSEGRFATPPYIFEFARISGKPPHGMRARRYEDAAPVTGNGEQPQAKTSQKPKKRQNPQINPKKVGATFYFGSASNQFM